MANSLVKKDKYSRYGYYFLIPFFIVMAVFIIYPLVYSIYLSFTSWDGTAKPPVFIGLDNFKNLIHDATFFKTIGNTIFIWLCNVIPQMIFAIGLAALLTQKSVKGRGFFRAAYFLPSLVTMASVGSLFFFLLDYQGGAINFILQKLGIIGGDYMDKIYFLQSEAWTRGATSFILWWLWFGYTMIIFMAGIKAIPEELYEAAYVDGASKWKQFRYITIPGLKSTISYNICTSIIGGMTIFDVPFTLTNGSGAPNDSALTMVMYLYNTAFQTNRYGYGATIGVALFIMIMIFVVIAFRFINRKPDEA